MLRHIEDKRHGIVPAKLPPRAVLSVFVSEIPVGVVWVHGVATQIVRERDALVDQGPDVRVLDIDPELVGEFRAVGMSEASALVGGVPG
jgi:hypothetical protein